VIGVIFVSPIVAAALLWTPLRLPVRKENETMHAGPYGEKKASLSPTTSGRSVSIETDDLSGSVLDGLDQLRRGDVRADAQQAWGVVADLRARNFRLDGAATFLGRDAAKEGCKLEALPPAR
jgi:hypothetical protein